MAPLKVGLGLPRYVGDPASPNALLDHKHILRFGQRAEQLGFDSVWVPDHFYFEWLPGTFEPFPDAWTLMTAIGVTTERVQIGSMVLAATFRHPALLAKMAGALQHLIDGRLLLGVGAGNQQAEHAAFGLPFDARVSRLTEYLAILHGLLANQRVTLDGRFYAVTDATLMVPQPAVPIWIAAEGERMLALTARYGSGWNGGGGVSGDGHTFRARLEALRSACRAQQRNFADIEVSGSANVLVLPTTDAAQAMVDHLATTIPNLSPQSVRERYVVGTPDQVVAHLAGVANWGVTHLICSLGARPFTLWSDEMLDLFAAEVLPRLRSR